MSPSLLVLFLFLISLYIFLKKKAKPFTGHSSPNLPPGSFGWPFVGESYALLRANWDGCPERFIRERVEKHGSPLVFKTSLLGDRMAMFIGPAGNKFLFSNENKLVISWWPKSVKVVLGHCLTNTRGDEAKCLRKLLLSYIGPESFSILTASMDTVTRLHFQTHWHGKEKVTVFPIVKLHTFELACHLFLSLEDRRRIDELFSLFNIFSKGVVDVPLNFPGTRFYRAKKAAAAIRERLLSLLKQRRVALEQHGASPSQDILSHLLVSPDENGRFLTESEIVNNILLLLFAGHDTSAVAITLVIKSLGEHPEVYEKVLREQLDIVEAKGVGELLQWEDIQKMRYSWNVVSEVLRLTPPINAAFREALVDFTYAGYDIPKGWKIIWSASAPHKDEDFFPDATTFDPSRFEGAGPQTPFSYVPFGGGPRMCVGKDFARLEILVFLHNVVTRFKWDLVIPGEKIEYDPMPTPVNGLPIQLHPHETRE